MAAAHSVQVNMGRWAAVPYCGSWCENWLSYPRPVCVAARDTAENEDHSVPFDTNEIFQSEDDAILRVQEIAISNGFELVRDSQQDNGKTLEESRNKNGIPYHGYPFYHLNSVVSHHCLQKLHKEYEKMQTKGDKFVTVDASLAIQVSDLNPFWANLNIDESPVNTRPDGLSDNQVLWKHLVGVVKNEDPLVICRANCWLYDQIYLDRGPSKQPENKKKGKGRPKGSKNKPHEQVYTKWDFRQPDEFAQDVIQQSIYEHGDLERIVPFMIPYITGYVDVVGDGKCGFRIMASHLFGSEYQWHNARRIGADELEESPNLYDFFFERDISRHVHRIRWYESPWF
ncbi:OLC1v1024516C1 [Oldenlandia corymbosa var. corymbosa]|uniref:OLC1v1024516C1 n=1 Tax=Oldenlandia corymbosa var. corymbosa TaxID=529605 RepID=A0AAV1C600_OLDCO|nr:OLC1v1024516C1 [Oldenlandia corymbosa var. corymbosa]